MNLAQQGERVLKQLLKPLDNKVVGTTARVALILYASLIAPELPDVVARQLDNLVVRSVLIFLIAYLAVKDPITAGLATLALMVTVMSLHRRDVQGVLGRAAGLAEKPANLAGQALEGAYDFGAGAIDTAAGVVQGAARMVGLNGEPVEEDEDEIQGPSGVEDGMDDAGML